MLDFEVTEVTALTNNYIKLKNNSLLLNN